jgi:hypothetical protein
MPISLDPKAVFRVVLEVDEGKSPQPAFLYRHLSALERYRTKDGMSAETDDMARLRMGLMAGFVGVENMIDPETGKAITLDAKDPDCILNLCTDGEIGEILAKTAHERSMTAEDRKKSGPPSPSELENSAADAAGSSRDAGGQ